MHRGRVWLPLPKRSLSSYRITPILAKGFKHRKSGSRPFHLDAHRHDAVVPRLRPAEGLVVVDVRLKPRLSAQLPFVRFGTLSHFKMMLNQLLDLLTDVPGLPRTFERQARLLTAMKKDDETPQF